MIELKLYTPEYRNIWNKFVAESKNGTFLHDRGYMDYHSDRFEDFSLMAYSDNKLVALLPANRVGNTLYSHQGLTYGGWITPFNHFDIINMMEIFDEMSRFLPELGISELIYKAIPHIYHKYPAEEDLYAIFRYGGELIETNVSTTIVPQNAIKFNRNSIRAVARGVKNGIVIKESEDYETFWKVLTERLNSKYKVNPVHTLDEINLLRERFPDKIRLFVGVLDEKIIGGCLIYDTENVCHVQYSASTQEGREKGILPLLYKELISSVFKNKRYFDFGISNEEHGQYLNQGLVMQKTGFGGRAIVHNIYKLKF